MCCLVLAPATGKASPSKAERVPLQQTTARASVSVTNLRTRKSGLFAMGAAGLDSCAMSARARWSTDAPQLRLTFERGGGTAVASTSSRTRGAGINNAYNCLP
jgi:hypothetical protein